MEFFKKAFCFPLLFLTFLFMSTSLFSWTNNYGTNSPYNSSVELDLDGTFSLLYGGKGLSVKGDMSATGDSILTTTKSNKINAYIESKYTLSDSTFGTHTDSRKRNSSDATLNLPSYVKGEYITFAGLFWQGSIHESKSGGLTTAQVDSYVKGWNQVTFKTPDGNYHPLTADLTKKDTTSKTYHYAFKDNDSYRWNYAAYVNVTDLVKDTYIDNNSTFTVGHILTTAGRDFNDQMYFKHEPQTNGLWPSSKSITMGLAGGWSLIVVYNIPQEDTSAYSLEDLRTVSIYDGYENFAIWDTYDPLLVSISISNFLTPKSGTINSKLLIFGGAGDYGITGDVLQIYNPNTSSYDTISNAKNPSGNQFNSSYTNLGTHMSSTKTFRNGVDLDIYDVSSSMGYGQTSTSINFGVRRIGYSADQIFPQVLAFSTQLYEPQLCYDYSIKQDGNYLDVDYDKYPIARLDSTVSTSDIEVTVYLRNKDSDFSAEGIAISSDVNTTLFNQTGNIYTSIINGSTLINRGTPISAPVLCVYNEDGDNSINNNGCTDGHNIRKGVGSLFDGEYIYAKWKVAPNTSGITDINTSLGLTLSYYITAKGNKIVYKEYPLGSENVPLCSSSSDTYEPNYGQFNVIKTGSSTNNLFTQISRKPFDVSVIFDSDPTDKSTHNAPNTNIKTGVLVEIVNMDAFADMEASCANPDSRLTDPIYTPLNFTTSNYQTTVPTQTTDYYNFAAKNASFRVWYFADSNNKLIKNWTATTTNNNKTITGISGLYQSSTHTKCATECSNDTTASCFECIKENYAYPICSRDNFSVRPESFDLRIYDINQTNATTDNSNIDLSQLKGFDPSSSATTDRIDLAAGYNYRYDMRATGHDNNDAVSGYTRYFNGSTDYNSTMYWDSSSSSATGCNDTDNINMSFYIKNGTMTNEKRNLTQVGDYRINIVDTSWTAVDWSNNSHHTTANGFSTSNDCVISSNSSTANAYGKYGCTITSNHGTVNGYTYQDHDLTFHPYKFGISNTKITLGLNSRDINTTDHFSNFVYMTDIGNGSSSDENMSVQLSTTITPQGFDGSSLSNFVTGCYAKPIDVNISTSGLINPTLTYKYIIRDLNTSAFVSGSQTNPTSEDANITTTNSFFAKSMNGTLDNTIKLNFDRDKNTVANPEDVNFTTITVSDPRTQFNALLENNKTAEGNTSINQNITYYFGRTAAKKTRIYCDGLPCTSGTNGELDVLIYYEVYCNATVNSNKCDRTLLPQLDSRYIQTVDSRWYANVKHTESGDGNLTATYENTGLVIVPTITNLNDYTKNSAHTYSGANGLPYTATMNSTVPNWLVYDEGDVNATTNTHTVIFRAFSDWTGRHETNTTTNTEKVNRVNRRTMW